MQETPKANKELGQHYLRDQNIIKKITSDFSSVASEIVEVGPGPATLTKDLAATLLPLTLLEKDERFKEMLESIVPLPQIIFCDAMTYDLTTFLNQKKGVWLVSNLPYNISSQLLVKFLQVESIEYMTLMFQKEVGDKILSHEKNSMSSLMALSQNYFEVKRMQIVKPGAFAPPPKVDSIVLSFKRLSSPTIPLTQFQKYEKFLRLLFSNRRKQIQKVLKEALPPDQVTTILQEVSIDGMRRSETLLQKEVTNLFSSVRGQND